MNKIHQVKLTCSNVLTLMFVFYAFINIIILNLISMCNQCEETFNVMFLDKRNLLMLFIDIQDRFRHKLNKCSDVQLADCCETDFY